MRANVASTPVSSIVLRATLLAAACAAAAARADDGRLATPLLPAYAQECSACHVAYPPALLPAASWRRLMANLPRHFGTDASLDAAAVREIGAWLDTHAAGGRRGAEAPPEDRITRSAWFVREHREVAQPAWKSPLVRSPANCAACHPGADRGDFDEDAVRIPR